MTTSIRLLPTYLVGFLLSAIFSTAIADTETHGVWQVQLASHPSAQAARAQVGLEVAFLASYTPENVTWSYWTIGCTKGTNDRHWVIGVGAGAGRQPAAGHYLLSFDGGSPARFSAAGGRVTSTEVPALLRNMMSSNRMTYHNPPDGRPIVVDLRGVTSLVRSHVNNCPAPNLEGNL